VKRRTLLQSIPAAALFPGMLRAAIQGGTNSMQTSTAVFELRTYHAVEGKLPELLARFRDHTDHLFAKHGFQSVAYWTPLDDPQKSNTLIYILQHPSRDAAAANWKAFQDDPEWKTVKAKSEEKGPLTVKIDSTYMALTDFSKKLR
jgi:hypothetical protein